MRICGALYLSRSSATSAPSPTPQAAATPESRYLAAVGEITAREQQAWLPAFNGFQNISDTYDDSWTTAHDAATHGIPIIKTAITTLKKQQPPHQFRQAQALLLHQFQLELTLTGYIKAMTTKHGLDAIVRLFDRRQDRQGQQAHHATGSGVQSDEQPPHRTCRRPAGRQPCMETLDASLKALLRLPWTFPHAPASAQTSRCYWSAQ